MLLSPQKLPADLEAALAEAGPRLGLFAGRTRYFADVSSTNDVAARFAAEGAEEGTTVVAGAQRAGRGRQGRVWFSAPGAGLYVSVVLRPTGWRSEQADEGISDSHAASVLTLVAGVALAETIRLSAGLPVEIKWPNDLVIDRRPGREQARRRKIAGILTEASVVGTTLSHVVLGFGINLHSIPYPAEIAIHATSIEAELGRPIDRAILLRDSLVRLARRYTEFQAGRIDAILARWRELAPSSEGARVQWQDGSTIYEGTTAGLDRDGALLVRSGSSLQRILSGGLNWID